MIMQKIAENLEDAIRMIKTADHLIYLSFPLLHDKRILLKSVSGIKEALNICINSILRQEYLTKKIRLYKDPKKNFKIFKDSCSKKYQITEQEIKQIIEIFEIVNHYKTSSMEFMKNEKVVILSSNMEKREITLENAKNFLFLTKNILKKTQENLEINIKTQKPL